MKVFFTLRGGHVSKQSLNTHFSKTILSLFTTCVHNNKGSLELRYWLENALQAKILTGQKKAEKNENLSSLYLNSTPRRTLTLISLKTKQNAWIKQPRRKKFDFQNLPRWSAWCPLRMCRTSGFSSRRSAYQCAGSIQRIWLGIFGLKGNCALIISIFEI